MSLMFGKFELCVTKDEIAFSFNDLVLFNRADLSKPSTFSI